ncbi:hypothetical protein M0R88_16690 [Halorussus gelatinilyticus]|uniref:ArsR family transcriptional regulator n=1 Tax=Halorussus gelatinilyticus TaxID=2937524 RepID=A0A8U0IGY9_9EURY|nr:hypothetical protein [Halorussus gelatinilyticus]UPW00138.1 hypothetical protein M0R88_16690 [Halorussus gelatinilyticus]
MNDGESDPTEVFDLVGNSTRMNVLRALASAHSDAPTDPWLEYGELQEAAGVSDNGNFNYHLDQLDDLVVKREAGYRLSRIGMGVVSTVTSGFFDPKWTWGPVDAPGDCLYCDDSPQLRYEDGILWLGCGTDDHDVPLSVPPSLLDTHPEEDVVEQIAFLENQWSAQTRRGICSECQGYVDGEIEFGGARADHYHYHGHCHRCGFQHGIPVGLFLVGHPAVVNFFYERGIDVRATPFWTLEFCKPGSETVLSESPLRLRVDVTHDGETLSLTLNREGSVVSTERTEGPAEASAEREP